MANIHDLYTERQYFSRDDLRRELPPSQAEIVWKQLLEYRQSLMQKLADGSHEICLCRCVLKELLDCQQSWMTVFRLSREGAAPQRGQSGGDLFEARDWSKVCRTLIHRGAVLNPRLMLLEPDSEPLPVMILQILTLQSEPQLRSRLIRGLMGYMGGTQLLLQLPSFPEELPATDLPGAFSPLDLELLIPAPADLTVILQQLCQSLTFQAKQSMLYFQQYRNENDAVQMDFQELQLRYPMLKTHQLQFYVQHREPGCYYTIAQFQTYSGVAYETARCALEQLSELGFYHKRKVGKKFSYQSR